MMLKSWSIENFKPIVNSGELKLAPVTVLAGRNSSGKSSLLQSILMIAQTLSNPLPERALIPNGPLVQLGTFESVLSDFSDSELMKVGFLLKLEQEQLKLQSQQSEDPKLAAKSAKVTALFNKARGNDASSAAVEVSNVTLDSALLEIEYLFRSFLEGIEANIISYGQGEVLSKLSLVIQKITNAELSQFLEDVIPTYLRFVTYSGRQANYFAFLIADDGENTERCLVSLSHFLPIRLIQKFKASRLIERLQPLLQGILFQLFDSKQPEALSARAVTFIVEDTSIMDIDIDASISDNLKTSVSEFCEANNIPNNFPGRTLRELIYWFKSLEVPEERKNIIIHDLCDRIVQNYLKTIFENQKGTEGLEVVSSVHAVALSQFVEQITRFFTSQIRYLGPIRADPATVRRTFAPSSQLDEVGDKGEYAAVVYHYNQLATIEWYDPDTKQLTQGTLQDALDCWAQYLGVAEEVRTEESGSMGVAWKIILKKGQKARTLPEVGVGVGQILPVLAMGLLSPENTLLLMEQPELHLHPSVQARLGDFFVGLSKCNKQCLIETHSENLVNQLRYHIVQSGGQEKSDCMIYFVDQDEKGAAQFNQIEISPQGNILNWPEGFFDETMLQEDRITAASIKKRATKAKNA